MKLKSQEVRALAPEMDPRAWEWAGKQRICQSLRL